MVLDYSVNKNKLHKNPCNSQDFLADIEIVEKEFEQKETQQSQLIELLNNGTMFIILKLNYYFL